MHPLPGECPIYQGEMIITRLECRECDIKIEGHFFRGCSHSYLQIRWNL